MTKKKHPKQLGFRLGLEVLVDWPYKIIKSENAAMWEDVVYVALLEGGTCLKVGFTKGTLKSRWLRTLGVLNPHRKLKLNEINDRKKWKKWAKGKRVEIWVREAGKFEIPYAKRLQNSVVSTRAAEEIFLDSYYGQKIGMSLLKKKAS